MMMMPSLSIERSRAADVDVHRPSLPGLLLGLGLRSHPHHGLDVAYRRCPRLASRPRLRPRAAVQPRQDRQHRVERAVRADVPPGRALGRAHDQGQAGAPRSFSLVCSHARSDAA
eukprot:48567-Rhodomonas_salina.1